MREAANNVLAYLFVHAVMVVLGLLVLLGCDSDAGRKSTDANSPISYHFGRVRAGTKVEHAFVLYNPGRETLEVVAVQTSCSCTAVANELKYIPPHSTAELPVTLYTQGKSGQIGEYVQVRYSNGNSTYFAFQGEVEPDHIAQIDFGPVLRGAYVAREFTVRWPADLELEVIRVDYDKRYFGAEATRAEDGARATCIRIALKPDAPYGQFAKTLVLQTNDELVPDKLVSLVGKVLDLVVAEPQNVMFGMLPVEGEKLQAVRVYSPYHEAIENLQLEIVEGEAVTWDVDRVSPWEFAVTLKARSPAEFRSKVFKSVVSISAGIAGTQERLKIEAYGLNDTVADLGARDRSAGVEAL